MRHNEYPEIIARFYDLIYSKIRTGTDDSFYLKEAFAAKGPVLEVGCGTGRLFMNMLDAGVDIFGLDISASMIEILWQKLQPEYRKRVFVADICNYNSQRKYDLIIAPFRVFSHLITVEEQLFALNNINDILSENGRFIFDLYIPDPKIIMDGFKNFTDFEDEYAPGESFKRIVNSISDHVNQITDVNFRFEWTDKDGIHSFDWDFPMRYYYRWEIEHLIKLSKLELVTIYGDFEGNILTRDSKEFVVICKKDMA